MKKEPVCIAVVVGASIAQILHFYLEVDPTIVILVEAAIFLMVRQYVVPHLPNDITDTIERLAKGTKFDDQSTLGADTWKLLVRDFKRKKAELDG